MIRVRVRVRVKVGVRVRADHQPLDDLDRVRGREVGESIDRVARRVLDRVLLVDELHERRVRLHAAREGGHPLEQRGVRRLEGG